MGKEHVSSQFDAKLSQIRSKLLEMGGAVELMIANSVKALVERDSELAERTIAIDAEINRMELEIDQQCLHLLALHQPAARDLRFVTLALKIVIDLERIGDQCAGISKQALRLNREPQLKPYIDLPRMADAASGALKAALDAFVSGDAGTASRICQDDRAVDELNDQLQRELLTFMMEDSANVERAMRITAIANSLERIADHATNIAEMVIFMVDGRDVRHSQPSGEAQ